MKLFDRKEKQLIEIMDRHFSLVGQALKDFDCLLQAYLEDGDISDLIKQLRVDEDQADTVRDEIKSRLHGGAFMSTNREDYIVLVDLVDEIANQAEDTGNLIELTVPPIPDFLQEGLRQLNQKNLQTFEALCLVFKTLNLQIKDVSPRAAEVSSLESEVDRLEWDLIKRLSASELDRALKRDLREVIQDLGRVSDLAEDAADRLKLMVIKQSF